MTKKTYSVVRNFERDTIQVSDGGCCLQEWPACYAYAMREAKAVCSKYNLLEREAD